MVGAVVWLAVGVVVAVGVWVAVVVWVGAVVVNKSISMLVKTGMDIYL